MTGEAIATPYGEPLRRQSLDAAVTTALSYHFAREGTKL